MRPLACLCSPCDLAEGQLRCAAKGALSGAAVGLPLRGSAATLTTAGACCFLSAGSTFCLGLSVFAVLFLSVLASLIHHGYPYAGGQPQPGILLAQGAWNARVSEHVPSLFVQLPAPAMLRTT